MRKSNFTKFIDSLDEEELREEMNVLYEKIAEVKNYYAMELGSDQDRKKLFANAKKSITRYYATKSYRKPKAPRIRYIQALLKEMHQLSIFNHEMIDLYLFDVETAINFMRVYYFSSKSVNNNVEKSFGNACKMINEGKLQDMFVDRSQAIMSNAAYFQEFYLELNRNFIATYR